LYHLESEIPGAKGIGAHLFVDRIIHGCHGEEALEILNNGLVKLNCASFIN
jgi:hypothetical protein